eukprot:GILK01015955.1.p2 GENE.GILK01015955.1~~GILK01015955.1.p2  ORF type:complete len:118 (-),score=23.82 GILK01015955.1:151-504(-)
MSHHRAEAKKQLNSIDTDVHNIGSKLHNAGTEAQIGVAEDIRMNDAKPGMAFKERSAETKAALAEEPPKKDDGIKESISKTFNREMKYAEGKRKDATNELADMIDPRTNNHDSDRRI